MKFGLKHLLLTSALAGVIAPVASAQDNPFLRGRHTAVTDRGQPEYDPEVIHVGSFDLSSSLYAGAEYNDNVFGQASGQQSDTVIRIRPEAVMTSNWSVHALAFGAVVDHREYLEQDSESASDYRIFADGRLDATRNVAFTGSLATGQGTEARYEPGGRLSEPARDKYVSAVAGVNFVSDRLQMQANVGTREDNYQSIYNLRDRSETTLSGRVGYAVSPDIAVFVQAGQSEFEYDAAGSANRNGSQTSLRVGANFEFSAPFAGEFSIGEVQEDLDDPAEADAEGLSMDARVQWFPTQLTTVTFSANAGISDPGILEATSATTQRFSIRADHELLRNVLLFGEAGIGNYEFNASAAFPLFQRKDDITNLAAGVAYKLNKQAHLEFAARHYATDSSAPLADARQTIVGVGLRLYP